MRCMSCGADIPPQFVHAIATNTCGGCGGEIMNEASKELLKELSDALSRMPNDPQGIAGWLMSNYRFQKMGEGKPVEKFHRKGGAGGGEYDESTLKIAPGYNEFIQRNDAAHLVTRSNELAAKAKGSKNGKLAEFASVIKGVSDPYGDNTVEEEDSGDEPMASPEDQKSYLELKASGFDPFMQSVPSTSSSEYADSDIVSKLARVMSQDEKPIAYEIALSQTDEGRKQLQLDNFKRIKAQDAVTGGGGGLFRRG
ncbi:hypothetical protein M0R72_01995 [Candidatus Pacearchaeota archaeon]|nr:hypothetical protein [Candidatus Pacearchaeota archaeon]